MNLYKKVVIIFFLFLCYPGSAHSIPAFPGAEGFGAKSIGGRGGKVVKVTNLNDSGPGSFREAVRVFPPRHFAEPPFTNWRNEPLEEYLARLDAMEPRIIVFEVSGIINLSSDLTIIHPFITIAGETSPGGILITGRQVTINTHDVIMRHMRFRVGSHRIAEGADPETLDSLDVLGAYWKDGVPADNIIIDHVSTSWGVDETFTLTGGVTNTTVQWSIASEGLSNAGHPKGEHSKGLMVSGKYELPNSVSLHHNYMAHNNSRNPLIEGPSGVDIIVDAVNNVSYNWNGGFTPTGEDTPKINWVHNYTKQGVNSNSYSFEIAHTGGPMSPLLYVFGNIGSTRLTQDAPQWNVGTSWRNIPLSNGWQKLTPWPVPPVTTAVMSKEVADCILTGVGATSPVRDSVDARVIADFAAGTGRLIDNVKFPDDFPIFQNLPAPADTDNDGMSDSWEATNGMTVGVDDSAGDKDGDGYTNIEEYLHYLSAKSYAYNSDCMPGMATDITPPASPANLRVD